MVRKIEYNVRHQAKASIRKRLGTIQIAAGYNTNPVVTEDYRHPDRGLQIIWVDSGTEVFESQGISQISQCALTILITGLVHVGPDSDEESLDALLQDIRSCIAAHVTGIADDINDGVGGNVQPMLTWGQCDTDQGILREEGEAMVIQPLIITYLNGPEW